MIGKLFGAWLGGKIAGPNRGARGALLGYGAAALARRSVPALAAVGLGSWAFRKWRDRRARREPLNPSRASPGLAPSDTRTPSSARRARRLVGGRFAA
jgi:hypothetical protein